MLSGFYRHYSRHLLIAIAASFPILYFEANSIPNNNEIETWLPDRSEVRDVYDRFKADFGDEEILLIGLPETLEASGLVEAVAGRVEALPGVRACWSPLEMGAEMATLGVAADEARDRMRGLCVSQDGSILAVMAVLSPEGIDNRAELLADVKGVLDYCQIPESDYLLAGHPVVITEMDRLGNKQESTKFFLLTVLVSTVLVYLTLRNWALSLSLLGITLWGIQFTTAVVKWCGGEANFILSALSVMVMVFTLSVSIHLVGYFRHARGDDRLGEALRMAWKPCFLAVLTTAIGLVSLTVSDMGPVRQFGWSAALGSVMSLLVGYGVTPAILTLIPLDLRRPQSNEQYLARLAFGIVGRSRWVVAGCLVVVGLAGWGLTRIESRIEPLDFLPQQGKVRTDALRIEEHLASASSIEAVVDFGGARLPFGDKLAYVRELTGKIESHPQIGFALSLSTLFPERLPSDPFEVMALLDEARSRNSDSDLIADGDRLWRISARLSGKSEQSDREVVEQLAVLAEGEYPVHFTGMEVLLEHAQGRIFQGFWESFSTAFLIISGIMVLSLRSLRAGLVAMIPNLFPIAIVFGVMGWLNVPVDIGTMMTGSIALGLAVDGTFHYLVRYNDSIRKGESSSRSARAALLLTGEAIFNAALVTALGMLALLASSFGPTARFGAVMCGLMLTAIVGDLLLLPALLSLRSEDRVKRRQLLKLSEIREREAAAAESALRTRRMAS